MPRMRWDTIDAEIRAMLPRTLDALERVFQTVPDPLPAASDTGRYAHVWPGRQRAADGRACGLLLLLGGCLEALPPAAETGRLRRAGWHGVVPGDRFRLELHRDEAEGSFGIRVLVAARLSAVPRRSGILRRAAGFNCSGDIDAWERLRLGEEDLAAALLAAFEVHRDVGPGGFVRAIGLRAA